MGYEKSCYNFDGANVLSDFQYGLPYEILMDSDTLLKMDATVPTNSNNSRHRAIIKSVRNGDAWKIKPYVTRSFTSDPLHLTILTKLLIIYRMRFLFIGKKM